MQALEKIGVLEQDEEKGGRRITQSGQRDLDRKSSLLLLQGSSDAILRPKPFTCMEDATEEVMNMLVTQNQTANTKSPCNRNRTNHHRRERRRGRGVKGRRTTV